MPACPRCSAPLETPSGCAACGAPLELADDASPFALLGLEPAWGVDQRALRSRLVRASRVVHPDFFGTAEPGVRALAERNSSRLNKAFQVLADDAARADWLVTSLGGPREDQERAMPQAFLLEVLEWNELLEEARAARGADPRLAGLERELRARRAAALERVGAALTPLPARGAPALRAARQELNAVRYVDRALSEVEALRLLQAEAR